MRRKKARISSQFEEQIGVVQSLNWQSSAKEDSYDSIPKSSSKIAVCQGAAQWYTERATQLSYAIDGVKYEHCLTQTQNHEQLKTKLEVLGVVFD